MLSMKDLTGILRHITAGTNLYKCDYKVMEKNRLIFSW